MTDQQKTLTVDVEMKSSLSKNDLTLVFSNRLREKDIKKFLMKADINYTEIQTACPETDNSVHVTFNSLSDVEAVLLHKDAKDTHILSDLDKINGRRTFFFHNLPIGTTEVSFKHWFTMNILIILSNRILMIHS